MIGAYATLNDRRTLIIGLSTDEVRQMLGGRPVLFGLRALLAGEPAPQDVAIVAGETEDDIRDELASFVLLEQP